MLHNIIGYFSPTKYWFNFSVLLLTVFLLKGVVYLSIIPPFEGWDEYQHLAYISYLEEHQERPILNEAVVSPALLERLVKYPTSESMQEQTKEIGTVTYLNFFNSTSSNIVYKTDHPDIKLYQAQHGDLYYILALRAKNLFKSQLSFVNTVYLLRLFNIVMIAASLAIILYLLNNLVAQKNHAALLALIIISQPLILINGCRITNDALAIVTGTGVIAIGCLPYYRERFAFSILVGILIGISCWVKSTSAILFPFWGCALLASYFRNTLSGKKTLTFLFLSYSVAIGLLWNYFSFNFHNYGMLFVIQEAIVNRQNNRALEDVFSLLIRTSIVQDILQIWFKKSIWIGGWSFLKVNNISNISVALISFSFLGWIYHMMRRKYQGIISSETSLLCFSIFFFTCLALSWHYLQSTLAWGQATTCEWYISMSLPFFLIFVYHSACLWSAKTGFFIGWSLFLLYLYADVRGAISMLAFYSGGGEGLEALFRIADIRPNWLGMQTLLASSTVYLILVFFSLVIVINSQRVLLRRDLMSDID